MPWGVFTLTETETDKMGLKPIGIGHCNCLGQYEHLHMIPDNRFLGGLGLVISTFTFTSVNNLEKPLINFS